MAEDQKALGKFVWHDLMTTDVDGAVAFYTGLFGWSIKEVDMGPMGMYKMIHAAGEEHGGFNSVGSTGQPPHWLCYATVDDVDAATAKAVELGGQAPEKGMDIPGVGRFGVIVDPAGAAICPYKPQQWMGEGYEGPERPGTFVWHELLASDPEAQGKFYSAIFGWILQGVDMGEMGTYHLFMRPDKADKHAGGMAQNPDPKGSSAWLPYVAVDDVDATAAKVTSLGGKICAEPMDIPDVGRIAVAADPQGAAFAFMKSASRG